ncbi:MAG: hypothetical protein ACI9Z3_000861, partial [Roseivirga sp.]
VLPYEILKIPLNRMNGNDLGLYFVLSNRLSC